MLNSHDSQEEAQINALNAFVECHNEYNIKRIHTSTEEAILKRDKEFTEQHPEIKFERSKEVNHRTFCAHGTNSWALFLACAFANGQLLPGNLIKLTGTFTNAGESHGKDKKGSNLVSAVGLLHNHSDLRLTFKYTKTWNNAIGFSIAKEKFLKKYTNKEW